MIHGIGQRSKALRETRVLLLRHGETAAPDRFHGAESDIELSALGRRQAEEVAKVLAPLGIDALYSSGMRRARETAEPIGRECALVPNVLESLHERRIGPLSGQSREAAWAVYTQAKEQWIAGNLDFTHEDGESYAELRRRVVPAFQSLVQNHVGQTIVIVAHGVVIRVLLTSLVEGFGPSDFGRIGIDNVAVNDLRWDGSRLSAVPFDLRRSSRDGSPGPHRDARAIEW